MAKSKRRIYCDGFLALTVVCLTPTVLAAGVFNHVRDVEGALHLLGAGVLLWLGALACALLLNVALEWAVPHGWWERTRSR